MSEDDEPEPYALTEEHVAALERAIRAEGYMILVETEPARPAERFLPLREPLD